MCKATRLLRWFLLRYVVIYYRTSSTYTLIGEIGMQTLCQDLRYGIRMLLKKPGFTLIAFFMLAFGIGANTAIFTVVNAVLLRPLPYPSSEKLMELGRVFPDSKEVS